MHDGKRDPPRIPGGSNKNTGREFLGGSHPIAVQRPMPDREVGGMVSALTRQMMATDARWADASVHRTAPGERVHANNSPN